MQFLETIKIKNKQVENIKFHNIRFNQTRQAFFDVKEDINLEDLITPLLHSLDQVLYKCRIVYGQEIEKIEFLPYQIPHIQSLKLIEVNDLDYSFKYADRQALQNLFLQKGEADDILILKNDLITDSYYCNIIFYDGKDWFTPKTPLLTGTQRAKLLENNIIQTSKITLQDLESFEEARLINAMLDFEDAPRVTNIIL